VDKFTAVWGGVAIALLIAIIALSVTEQRNWETFQLAHSCKVVEVTSGSISVGYANSGVIVLPQNGKIAWLCDNGVTYWK